MRDQLSSLFHHSDSSSTIYQPFYVLDTTTYALKDVFLQMLFRITSPVARFVFAVIFVLFLVWAVILTLCTIRILIRNVISTIRSRQHNSNSTPPLTSSIRFLLIPIQANLAKGTIFFCKKWFICCCLLICYICVILHFNNVLFVSFPARSPLFFLSDCLLFKRSPSCSYALQTWHSGGKICCVRAVRRACGATAFVVAYFPAFCESIISK